MGLSDRNASGPVREGDKRWRQDRRDFSCLRVEELRTKLNELPEAAKLPKLCVFATGSYAREEAGPHSDIDFFFVHEGSLRNSKVSRLDELRLFARVVDIGVEMKFPTFSNDGEFLRLLYLDDMVQALGGREDDSQNYFTARMLLLLESKPLVNQELLNQMLSSIVDAYFRDYLDHAENFRPVFLVNDILRFWKTLCLNYENKRSGVADDQEKKVLQQVKNFKLKFSRLMTCFGTIVAICSEKSPICMERITSLTQSTPLERFLSATDGVTELEDCRSKILKEYQWFMECTALPTEELRALFGKPDGKSEMFSRAEEFGNLVYEALDFLADRNNYRRYLVV